MSTTEADCHACPRWPANDAQWRAVQGVYGSVWAAMEQVGKWMRQGDCPPQCFRNDHD